MKRICPRCGTPDNEVGFVGEKCINCALEGRREKWPVRIEMEVCSRCGKIRRGNDWKENHPQLLGVIVSEKMKGVPGHYNIERKLWEGIWEQGGDSAPFEHAIELAEKRSICISCNRSTSGYFEAIIQLRGNPDKIEKYGLLLQKRLSKITFLPRIEDMHGGLDIYVMEKKDVPEILFHLNLKYARSEKLSGEKKGKRLYRSTFLVRFDEEGETAKGRIKSGG